MRQIHKLTVAKIRSVDRTKPGVHGDGGGLYLQVSQYGTTAWLFRYMIDGVAKNMGLGSTNDFSLAEARERAKAARQKLADHIDPLAEKRAQHAERRLEKAKAVSFRQAAERYMDSHKAGWRNARHASQWSATLATFAYPIIGNLPVAAVDTALVLKVLEPIWTTKNETASRLRGRIESVLDWARVRGYRAGDNPARWKGHLDHLLPAPGAVQRDAHHAALPYGDLPAFMAALRAREGVASRALEFAVLTAARAGEVVGALWSEIDFSARAWIIPGARMKSGREHRVPLSDRAIAILETLPRNGELVFPGMRDDILRRLVRTLGERLATTHGFRSSFRDWAAEQTAYPAEMAELALAHRVGNAVENAYRRSDMLAKRARMMADWSAFCAQPPTERGGSVVPIRASAS